MKKPNKNTILHSLRALYARMDQAYAASAAAIGLSCEGCADSCCETLFRHHTHLEWLDLSHGLAVLPPARLAEIREAAEDYVRVHRGALPGTRPRVPCPLAVHAGGGLACGLYEHRPMICRLHGVPSILVRPGGQHAAFPGCDRAQSLAKTCEPALLDRSPLLAELARLEMELMAPGRTTRPPRVDLTIAEMILQGAPKL